MLCCYNGDNITFEEKNWKCNTCGNSGTPKTGWKWKPSNEVNI